MITGALGDTQMCPIVHAPSRPTEVRLTSCNTKHLYVSAAEIDIFYYLQLEV